MTIHGWLVVYLLVALGGMPSAESTPEAQEDDGKAHFYATATVRERAVESTASSVTVLDRAVIESSGAIYVSELLPRVPGVTLVSGGTRGGLTVAQIRGGDPNFTRVLVDGVPVNDGTYQVGGVFNLEALPTGAIERIEVVRGPLSSIYGSTGLAGAVQVITRSGRGPLRTEAELTTGNADLFRAGLSLAVGDDEIDVFAHLLDESESGRVAEESYDLTHFQARARRALRKNRNLKLAARVADWQGDDYPDASGGPLLGSGELRSADHRELSLSAGWVSIDSKGRLWRVDAAGYQHDLARTSPAIFPLVPESVEDTRMRRYRFGGALSAPSGDGSWSVGVDGEREEADNRSLLLLPPFLGGAVSGDYEVSRTTPGAYGEWVHRQGRWTLELGLRSDFPEGRSEELSPRLGLVFALSDDTRVTLSAGRAFKLPSFFALVSPPALGGNPELEPEIMTGGDLGLEHRFAAGKARVGLKVFSQRFADLVDFDFATFSHVNRSKVDSRGVELTFETAPRSNLSVSAQVTYQDVEDVTTGAPLRHRPEWSGALSLWWREVAGFDLLTDLRFVDQRIDEQIPVPERTRVDGYELLGLAISRDLGDTWRFSVRLDNLTDESYETLIGFPGPSRSSRLTVRRTFGG